MNYSQLISAVVSDTHRPDLTAEVPRFIRLGEGLIRRSLTGYELETTMNDGLRVSAGGGVYVFPGDFTGVVIRSIHLTGTFPPSDVAGDALDRVAPAQIRRLPADSVVTQYAQYGSSGSVYLEFRGIPPQGQTFLVRYFGQPASLESAPNGNALLSQHEGLYLAAAKFYVYLHTQDRELAQDELAIFQGIIDTLNDQAARTSGGSVVAPVYNFSGGSSY